MDFPSWRQKWLTTLLMVVVLHRIGSERSYGRDIVDYTRAVLGEEIRIPTVYSMLKRLRDGGYAEEVASTEKAPETRGTRRKYYELTAAGREYLGAIRGVLEGSIPLIEKVMRG